MENSLFHDIYAHRAEGSLTKADSKRNGILQAALSVVLRYGYNRATMDDIAKECGISRPALYQFFKNKQEIYRATTSDMCDLTIEILKEELAKPGHPREVLFNGLQRGLLDMMAQLAGTTHGSELLDLKSDLSEDIIANFVQRMIAVLTGHFEPIAKDPALPAVMMATNLVLWIEGMKTQISDPTGQSAALKGFLMMQFAALGKQDD